MDFRGGLIPKKVCGLFCVGVLHPHTNFIQISKVHELTHVRGCNLERKFDVLVDLIVVDRY